MAHLVNPPPAALATHMGAGSSPGCSSSSPALCCGPGGQWRMAQVLGPCICVGDQQEAPGSWLRISAAPAVAAIWGVNQWKGDLSVSVYNSTCQIN